MSDYISSTYINKLLNMAENSGYDIKESLLLIRKYLGCKYLDLYKIAFNCNCSFDCRCVDIKKNIRKINVDNVLKTLKRLFQSQNFKLSAHEKISLSLIIMKMTPEKCLFIIKKCDCCRRHGDHEIFDEKTDHFYTKCNKNECYCYRPVILCTECPCYHRSFSRVLVELIHFKKSEEEELEKKMIEEQNE